MKTKSAKAKGRRLQQKVVTSILEAFREFEIHPDEVTSTIMGAKGVDVRLTGKARELFPFAIECANQERINFWKKWEQCEGHAATTSRRGISTIPLTPLLIVSRGHEEHPLAVVPLPLFLKIWGIKCTLSEEVDWRSR